MQDYYRTLEYHCAQEALSYLVELDKEIHFSEDWFDDLLKAYTFNNMNIKIREN